MSATTLSRARDALAGVLAAAALLAAVPRDASAMNSPPLPPAVASLAPQARAVGGGELRFMGLSVYAGYYWASTGGFSLAEPFALDLHYRRKLEGRSIAQRSADEIERLGYGAPAERARWRDLMRRMFPDVREGDRITGVNLPGEGAKFFLNGRLLGEIADIRFAGAFFGIWFDPKTSQPAFRRKLLGEN